MANPILNQPHFQDEEKAREYLEALRWPQGAVCPHCGSATAHYKLEGETHRPGLWKCKDCREQFTVTVGTVFERSKIKLNVWLMAVHLICAAKNGMSSKELERILGVTYKTAWFMSHRIREAMKEDGGGLLGGGGGTVEADETYWGASKRSKAGQAYKGRGYAHKQKIFSLVERGGKVRSFHVADVTAKTLKPILLAQVSKEAKLMTDEASMYTLVGREFASHEVVAHGAKEYQRGEAHTNTIENYFSRLKRGLIGTYHKVGEQHLNRYAREFDFRYNTRKVSDTERSDVILRGIGGKRLMYRHTSPSQLD
jgi:transposase-like protein